MTKEFLPETSYTCWGKAVGHWRQVLMVSDGCEVWGWTRGQRLGSRGEGELCPHLQVRRLLDLTYAVQRHLFFTLIWESTTGVSMTPLKGLWDQFPAALIWHQFSRVWRNAYLQWQAAGGRVFLYYSFKSFACESDQANLRP